MQTKRRATNWRTTTVGALLASLALILAASSFKTDNAQAATIQCQPIVKYTGGSSPFSITRVLIVHPGEVTCAEARKILWKVWVPGGFAGMKQGWECENKGFDSLDYGKNKCIRIGPDGTREVIKTTRSKPCPSCTANKT